MSDSVVHVVVTGDPCARTASLTIRRDTDTSTWTTLDLKDAQVTVAEGAYERPAVLLSLRCIDSAGDRAVFQRHLHSVNGLLYQQGCGPPAHVLATAISSASLCANTSAFGAPAPMPVDQGAGAGGDGGAAPPPVPPPRGEEAAVLEALSHVKAPPPEGKRHLAVIGNGYATQSNAAVKSVPNVGLDVVHLQSAAGFRAVVPHLFGRNPAGVAELVLVIGDPELYPIQLIPTRNPQELRARDQAIDALVAGVSASAELLSKPPGSPSISLYVWDEFDPTKRDPSKAVSEKLERLYGKSDDVRVLSQFLREQDGGFSAQARLYICTFGYSRYFAHAMVC